MALNVFEIVLYYLELFVKLICCKSNDNYQFSNKCYLIALILFVSTTLGYVEEIKKFHLMLSENSISFQIIFDMALLHWCLAYGYALTYILVFRMKYGIELWKIYHILRKLLIEMDIKPNGVVYSNLIILAIFYYIFMSNIIKLTAQLILKELSVQVYLYSMILLVSLIFNQILILQYNIFLSIIKNYYRGINALIKHSKEDDWNLSRIKLIGKCHQMLYDVSKFAHATSSPIFLLAFLQAFEMLVANLYRFAAFYFYGDIKWENELLLIIYRSVISLLIITRIILVPEMCRKEVSKNSYLNRSSKNSLILGTKGQQEFINRIEYYKRSPY